MTDINHDTKSRIAAASPGRDGLQGTSGREALHEFAELLFFAYRDFISDPDAILAQFGFGRAHHRVLHFVARYPGLRVADLLETLKITKQSLARVLKGLVDQGFIDQHAGRTDRRERRLHLTERGRELVERLQAPQRARIERALRAAEDGADIAEGAGKERAPEVVRLFLYYMINERERGKVSELFASRPRRVGEGAEE